MAITAAQVKELREKTGAGMMDCKKALTECEGDIAKAVDWLREKGIAKSAKKEGRIAAEGLAAIGRPINITFPAPGPRGRDSIYWQNVKDSIHHTLANELTRRGGQHGDLPKACPQAGAYTPYPTGQKRA